MDEKILRSIAEELDLGRKVALAIITKSGGSTPRKSGTIMGITENGRTIGTIGGGAIEASIIKSSMKAIENEKGTTFEYKLNENGELKMTCGGDVEGYIKVFLPKPKLIVIGGGHISQSICRITDSMNFRRIVIEDREEYKDNDAFKNIDEFVIADDEEGIKDIDFKDSFVVIATRGHKTDLKWLKIVFNKGYRYIGVLGSKKKALEIRENLRNDGFDEKLIEKMYLPIGLGISDGTPEEIAFSIISEILLVKNNGKLVHMKNNIKDNCTH